jgi:hypothetical protein
MAKKGAETEKEVTIPPKTGRVIASMLGQGLKAAPGRAFGAGKDVVRDVGDLVKGGILAATGPWGLLGGKVFEKTGDVFRGFQATRDRLSTTKKLKDEEAETMKDPPLTTSSGTEKTFLVKGHILQGDDDTLSRLFDPPEQVDRIGIQAGSPDTSEEESNLILSEQTGILTDIGEEMLMLNATFGKFFQYTKIQDKLEAERLERLRKAKPEEEGGGLLSTLLGGALFAKFAAPFRKITKLKIFSALPKLLQKITKPFRKIGKMKIFSVIPKTLQKFGKFFSKLSKPLTAIPKVLGPLFKPFSKFAGMLSRFGGIIFKVLGPLGILITVVTTLADALKGFQQGGIRGVFEALLGQGGKGGAVSLGAQGALLGMMFGGPLGAAIGGGVGAIIGYLGFDKIASAFEMVKETVSGIWDWMKTNLSVESIKNKFGNLDVADKLKSSLGKALDFLFLLPVNLLTKALGQFDATKGVAESISTIADKFKGIIYTFFKSLAEGLVNILPNFAGMRERAAAKLDELMSGFEMPDFKTEKPALSVNPTTIRQHNPLQITAPQKGWIDIKHVQGPSDVKATIQQTEAMTSMPKSDPGIRAALGALVENSGKQIQEMKNINKRPGAPVVIPQPASNRQIPTNIENAILFLVNRGDL